jgi:chromosomal replication initiator protein
VCAKYYIGKKTLLSKDRHREIVRVRSIMHNLLFEEFGISISSIGRYFNQDHTTVLYSLRNKQKQTRYWGREYSIWQEYEEIKKALSELTGI